MKLLLFLIFLSCAFGNNIQRQRFAGRIIGGANSSATQFPYLVSLQADEVHYCGGSIINPTNILTAARCVDGMLPVFITTYAGSNDLAQNGVTLAGFHYIMHPNYDPNKEVNDIAILALVGPLKYSPTIQPIQVDSRNIQTGVQCVISRWGTILNTGENPSQISQYFNLNISDLNDCKILYGENKITGTNICAMSQRVEGNCLYDAGGPLVADEKQIGIASWVNTCAGGEPDVYTRVSSFAVWIQDNLIAVPH